MTATCCGPTVPVGENSTTEPPTCHVPTMLGPEPWHYMSTVCAQAVPGLRGSDPLTWPASRKLEKTEPGARLYPSVSARLEQAARGD